MALYSPNGVWGIFVNPRLQPIRGLGLRPPPAQYLIHKSLAASHVAASYWTASSDVAATSAPVNVVDQRRSTPPATGQRRRITVVIGGQRWQSTPPATGQRRRITVVIGGQRWRSMTVAGGEPSLVAAGPPVTTGQRWLVNSQRWTWAESGSGLGRVQVGSGSGLDWFWAGSATCQPQPSSDTRIISKRVANQVETPSLDNILTLTNWFEDILGVTTNSVDSDGVEADVSNMETAITASPTPTLRIHKDHPKSQIISPVDTLIQTKNKSKENLVDCSKGVRPIGTKWVLKNKKDERGIVIRNKARLVAQGHTQEEGIDYDEVFAPIARIEAIRLFLAYASFMGFTVYQMDVKSAFLYGTIDEELCREFEALMHEKFQMSAMGELNFFLGLQVLQKEDGIFLSQDKYVGDILKKFGYSDFWSMARIETTEEGTKILATVDGILRTVTKSSLRRNLKLQDEEGISSLLDTELFENLTLMGYNISPNQKFTFQKGQFSHQWKYLIHTIMQCLSPKSIGFNEFSSIISTALGEGSSTPSEPYHTPSPKAQHTSYTTHSSPTLPPVTTAPIPTVTQSDTPNLRQYTKSARIAQSSVFLPVADEPASPLRDVSQGEACFTDFDFGVDQDSATIAKTSTLPYDSAPRVTSPATAKGNMQQTLNELTAFSKPLEDREGVAVERSRDDAPIKGRNLDEREIVAERVSDDIEEMATVLTSIDASTVLASGVAEVPTGSGSIPTAGPPAAEVPTGNDVVPTAGLIFATATVVTSYTRRKGKETMVESETPKKKKIQEQMDIQMARQLKEEMERDA
nr:copia protein [Tanacetum cinerariifolium]